MKKQNLIILLISVLALGFVYFNSEHLWTSPFETSIDTDEPSCIEINEEGYTSLIDVAKTRVLIISPDGRINAVIKTGGISDAAINEAKDLAMSSVAVYVLDQSEGDEGITGERVLKYDLQGNYLGTLCDTANAKATCTINAIACDETELYAVCQDLEDPSTVLVKTITNGKLKDKESYVLECDPYTCAYQPELGLMTVIACDGRIYKSKDDKLVKIKQIDSRYQINELMYEADGSILALDVNRDALLRFDKKGESKTVVTSSAECFALCDGKLAYADILEDSVHWLELESGNDTKIELFNYAKRITFMSALTWLLLGLGVAGLLLVLIRASLAIFRCAKEESEQRAKKYITTGKLYGRVLVIASAAFIITGSMFGAYQYNREYNKCIADVRDKAYMIAANSKLAIGDDLDDVSTQADYGSDEYNELLKSVKYSTLESAPFEDKTEMSCIIYHFIDGSDSVSVVSDPLGENRIGTVFNRKDQKIRLIKEGIDSARKGSFNLSEVSYSAGTDLYQVYAPVFSSKGEVVGAVVPTINVTAIRNDILMDLIVKLLEIFTLLAGLGVIVAEAKYAIDLIPLQNERRRNGIRNATLVEADRTINILLKMPNAVFCVFITLISMDILEEIGKADNAFLVSLPVSLLSALYLIFRPWIASFVKYNPKKWMIMSGVFTIAGAGVVILGIAMTNYPIFLIGSIVLVAGSALGFINGPVVEMSGKEPAEEYKLMVFSSVEVSIGFIIASSIGSVIRETIGDIGIMVFLIVCSVVSIPTIKFFVGDDLNAEKIENTRGDRASLKKRMQNLKKISRPLLTMEVFSTMILMTIPLGFLHIFSSYLLPLVNESEGLPNVLIGTITFFVMLFMLIVIPYIVKILLKYGKTNAYGMAAIMAAVAFFLLLLGVDASMKSLAVLLFAIGISDTLCNEIGNNLCYQKAEETGINGNEILAMKDYCYQAGGVVGPFILSLILARSLSMLGYVWGLICLVCAALIFVLNINKKRVKDNTYNESEIEKFEINFTEEL